MFRVISFLFGVILFSTCVLSASFGQAIEPRKIAAYGPVPHETSRVWETDIAAGAEKVMTVFRVGNYVTGYVEYNRSLQTWMEEGIIPFDPAEYDEAGVDPTVEHDRLTGGFMAAVLGKTDDPGPTHFQHMLIATCPGTPGTPFTNWESIWPWESDDLNANHFDKPWLIAGETTTTDQEYYITWWGPRTGTPERNRLHYQWWAADNQEEEWVEDLIKIDDQDGQSVVFCPQPAVIGDGSFYVAYLPANRDNTIFIILGVDDYQNKKIDFSFLTDVIGENLIVPFNGDSSYKKIPQPTTVPYRKIKAARTPQLVADPTNENRLYLVHHDRASGTISDPDINVYCHKITKNTGGYWELGDRIKVNDDPEPDPGEDDKDQFLPSAIVDDEGRIHVIFYDDREYTQDDGYIEGNKKPLYDVYYAVSNNHGQSFVNYKLYSDPEQPALDFNVWDGNKYNPGEYIGIDWSRQGEILEIWTSYVGTWLEQVQPPPRPHYSVIYSTRITFP